MLLDEFSVDSIYQTKKAVDNHKKNAWMAIFSDLLSLLLTFFILLFVIGEQSKGRWQDVSATLVDKFNPQNDFSDNFQSDVDVDYLYQVLQDKILKHVELKDVYIGDMGDKLLMSMPMSSLFVSENSSQLKPESHYIIYLLASTFFEIENEIWVNAAVDTSITSYDHIPKKMAKALDRAQAITELLKKNSLVTNIKFFLLDKHHYNINFANREDLRYSDRIDIVVNDIKVKKSNLYNAN
jgi:hypothetical protein